MPIEIHGGEVMSKERKAGMGDAQVARRVDEIQRTYRTAGSAELERMIYELERLQKEVDEDLDLWDEIERLKEAVDEALFNAVEQGKSAKKVPGAHSVYR